MKKEISNLKRDIRLLKHKLQQCRELIKEAKAAKSAIVSIQFSKLESEAQI